MAFSPFARFRNFTVDNLKALLEIYPDMAKGLLWSDAAESIEEISHGYKKTAYQQACQFGLEDRGESKFRIQSYLYSFDDDNLERYLTFWLKTYYAPNPYINSNEAPILIYCEVAKEILNSGQHKIDYYDFFNRRIGGKSEDILLNALKTYGAPLKYLKLEGKHYLYVEEHEIEYLQNEVNRIEHEFSILDSKDRKIFFDRYNYSNYCRFFGILVNVPEPDFTIEEEYLGARKTGGENILLYGVPGAGKSFKIQKDYCADPRFIERVVFHPDYMYSDFVGQILPRVIEGNLKYVFTPGPFTTVLKKAWENPSYMFYLIIEELNRGNAPAIFGEIFQLLDRKQKGDYLDDEIGESEYGITNFDVAQAVYGKSEHQVRIPSNLTVLATLNTADQNVFTLDTAFQRRWDMKQISNNFETSEHSKDMIEGTSISWGAFATTINRFLLEMNQDMVSSEDKRLGTYFVKTSELQVNKFPEKVLKYLWDDAFKMDKSSVFKEDCLSLEEVIIRYESSEEDKLASVLRTDVYRKMIEKMQNKNQTNG